MGRGLRWLIVALVLGASTPFLSFGANGAEDGDAADAFGYRATDYSLMALVDVPCPFAGRKGCYPVGNGLVFAHLGVGGDFNGLRGITGPSYQTRDEKGNPLYWADGEWPALGATLHSGSQALRWSRQSIQRIRGVPMVKVEQESGRAELSSLTYAVAGDAVIIREFVLKAGEFQRPMKLSLDVGLPLEKTAWRDDGTAELVHGDKRLLVSLLGAVRRNETGGWWLPLLPSGGELRFALVLRFFSVGEHPPVVAADAIPSLRQRTLDWWREWSESNIQFESPDAKFNDLMNELPMLIEVQRDAASGGVAPMVSYHGLWVRDSNGAILALLANGKYAEVAQMLTYYRKLAWKERSARLRFALDEDVSGVTPGDDWGGVALERAEVPSWSILQHYWYWRYSGDLGFIRQALPFLKHNAFALALDPQWGLKFHGDETYANGSLYSTYDREESGRIGYPDGYIPTDFFSFDNTLLHQEAALALVEMCRASGDDTGAEAARELADKLARILEHYQLPNGAYSPAVSDVTHELWYAPFSNINLRPYWLSLLPPKKNAWKDYVWARELVARKRNSGTTPYSGYQTGHNLGYWLTAAGALDTPEADSFFKSLVRQALPDGAWVEVYNPDGEPVPIYGRINRLRPWESGINYEAILRYLTGLQLAPRGRWCLDAHLPSEWTHLQVSNLHAAGACFDLEIERNAGWTLRLAITVEGGENVPPLASEVRFVPLAEEAGPLPRIAAVGPQVPKTTRLLVLTKDGKCRETIRLDKRFRKFRRSETAVWDIAMPFNIADLRKALLDGKRLRVAYLFLDDGVRDADRRTFKDAGFWESEDLKQLFADYEAAGGQVVDANSLEIAPAVGVLHLRLLIVLYTNTFTWKMSDADIANFHQEIAEWISWMDEVAGDRVQLEPDFLQIDRWLPPLQSGPQGGGIYWMGWSDVADDLERRGIPRNFYDSFAVFWAWDRNARKDAHQAYGGAAQGPSDDVQLLGEPNRMSYFGAAVLKDLPDITSKIALHEYLHDIDAMLAVSGHPDWFFSPDDMAKLMDLLLSEQPGAFEVLGYSDSAMKELAEKEAKREASFPWRTQLIYYRWMLERTPKAHFLRVFPHLGYVAPRSRRRLLYHHFILPEGEKAYQIAFDRADAAKLRLTPITLLDKERDKEHVNLERSVWAGAIEPAQEVLRTYAEAELAAPEKTEIVLGAPEQQVQVTLHRTGVDASPPVAGATVKGELGEQALDFAEKTDGVYAASLPDLPKREMKLTISATARGLTVSPIVVLVHSRPIWSLSLPKKLAAPMCQPKRFDFTIADPSPDAKFTLDAQVVPFENDLTRALTRDGFMGKLAGEPKLLTAGFGNRYSLILPALPAGTHTLKLRVTREVAGSKVRLVHEFPIEVSSDSVEFVVDRDEEGAAIGYLSRGGKALPSLAAVIYDNGIFAGPLPLSGAKKYRVPAGPPAEKVYLLRGGKIPVKVVQPPPDTGAIPPVPSYFLIARPLEHAPAVDELSANDPRLSPVFEPPYFHLLQGDWRGADDASGRLGFGFDSGNLYVFGVMKDDRLRAADLWDSDRINLVFDARDDSTEWNYPNGAVGYQQWARDDYWIFANLFQEKPVVTRMGGESPSGKLGYWGAVADAKLSVAKTNDGFKFVLTLPLSSLPHLSAQPGTACGFSTFYSDWDDALTEIMFFTKWDAEGGSVIWAYWNTGVLYFAQ